LVHLGLKSDIRWQ